MALALSKPRLDVSTRILLIIPGLHVDGEALGPFRAFLEAKQQVNDRSGTPL